MEGLYKENLRGGALMVLAMTGFALEDLFIKRLSADLPVGQILTMLGIGGVILFSSVTIFRRQPLFSRDLLTVPILARNMGELITAISFVSALALTPLSSASAILQAMPLAVTFGAALFFGEEVGWRRWTAIFVGFLGVLMIIRPGLDGFQPASLLSVIAVAGLTLRDLSTRKIDHNVSALQISAFAFASIIPAGLVMMIVFDPPVSMSGLNWRDMISAQIFGVLGYYAIVAATREGDVSFVTPFRYTRLVIALIFGVVFFGERPGLLTLSGAALIIVSGLYTLWRERRLAHRG